MYRIVVIFSLIAALTGFNACSDNKAKTEPSDQTEKEDADQGEKTNPKQPDVKQLVGANSKPDSTEFEETDFVGTGKIELPKGTNWEKTGNELYNKAMDMTIITQGQPGDFTGQINDYVDSYIDVNKRDAPKYEVVQKEEGEVKGIKCVRLDGKFDNGTAYLTRDYIFFTNEKVAVLMCRIAKKNEGQLNGFIDYIASSYQKKY